MLSNRIFSLFALVLLAVLPLSAADKVVITITNPATIERKGEMVEINVEQIVAKIGNEFVISDGVNEIPYQVTYDKKLIFQTDIPAKGKQVYTLTKGTPKTVEPRVMGRLFTERGDEFGWENDRVAYRIYGHGGAVGYDLFNKKTSRLMLNYWYASEQDKDMRAIIKKLSDRGFKDLSDQVYNAFCYHIDHGDGMDCYTVGPTLGAGASALLDSEGKLVMPYCYKTYEIVDNGPLRFTAILTYPPVSVDGKEVKEKRIVSLDAGSNFNRVTVSYNDAQPNQNMVSGVVVHKQNPDAYVYSQNEGYIGYEDLGDANTYGPKYREELAKQMGKIFVGTVYPSAPSEVGFVARESGIATGHVLATSLVPDRGYTYYFGSAWDQNAALGITSLDDWKATLQHKSATLRQPLRIKIR